MHFAESALVTADNKCFTRVTVDAPAILILSRRARKDWTSNHAHPAHCVEAAKRATEEYALSRVMPYNPSESIKGGSFCPSKESPQAQNSKLVDDLSTILAFQAVSSPNFAETGSFFTFTSIT